MHLAWGLALGTEDSGIAIRRPLRSPRPPSTVSIRCQNKEPLMLPKTTASFRTILPAVVLLSVLMAAGCSSAARRPEPRPELINLSRSLDEILIRGKLPAIPKPPSRPA